MVDQDLLSIKISRLKSYISELRNATDITWEKYRTDIRSKAFVERYLHLAAEQVLDIGIIPDNESDISTRSYIFYHYGFRLSPE